MYFVNKLILFKITLTPTGTFLDEHYEVSNNRQKCLRCIPSRYKNSKPCHS